MGSLRAVARFLVVGYSSPVGEKGTLRVNRNLLRRTVGVLLHSGMAVGLFCCVAISTLTRMSKERGWDL